MGFFKAILNIHPRDHILGPTSNIKGVKQRSHSACSVTLLEFCWRSKELHCLQLLRKSTASWCSLAQEEVSRKASKHFAVCNKWKSVSWCVGYKQGTVVHSYTSDTREAVAGEILRIKVSLDSLVRQCLKEEKSITEKREHAQGPGFNL